MIINIYILLGFDIVLHSIAVKNWSKTLVQKFIFEN